MANTNSQYDTVTLNLDGNQEVECAIIRVFPAGGHDYIALLPLEDEESDEVFLYRYEEEDGEPTLLNIESDEEYETVSKAFEEELDAMEMEELDAELEEN